MTKASLAAFCTLCGLILTLQTAQAGPRLTIGFVSLPPGTTSASCASAAKSALDPLFGNARIQSGNGHAYNGTYTVILYCDVDVHQAYIIVSGNEELPPNLGDGRGQAAAA